MKHFGVRLLLFALCPVVAGCQPVKPNNTQRSPAPAPLTSATPVAMINPMPVVHVFVALADNEHQGIVPVSASLGNGDNPQTNLYWGAAFGVKTFFTKSKEWELLSSVANPSSVILERSVFKHRKQNVFLIADAYRGSEISQATLDFLAAAAGQPGYAVEVKQENRAVTIHAGGSADVLAYIGHDGLMDFKMPNSPEGRDKRQRQVIILACASKPYLYRSPRTHGRPALAMDHESDGAGGLHPGSRARWLD